MVAPKSIESLKKKPNPPELTLTLASQNPLLDEFLEGGLHWGEVCEWGIPWGQALRDMILPFLSSAQQYQEPPSWILWIYGQKEVMINPLAWQARNINLNRIRFCHAHQPIHELKPLFLSSFFNIVVIDSVAKLSEEECAFLARQARRHKQIVFILRPYLLSHLRGNVWAKTRINCWRIPEQQRVYAKILKGRSPRQVVWHEHLLYRW